MGNESFNLFPLIGRQVTIRRRSSLTQNQVIGERTAWFLCFVFSQDKSRWSISDNYRLKGAMKDTIFFLIGPCRIGSSTIKIIGDTLIFRLALIRLGLRLFSASLSSGADAKCRRLFSLFASGFDCLRLLLITAQSERGKIIERNFQGMGPTRAGLSRNCHVQESAKTSIALLKPKKRGIAYSFPPISASQEPLHLVRTKF